MTTLDYFKKLINKYYMSLDKKEKEILKKNIITLYDHLDVCDFNNEKYYNSIKAKYLRFIGINDDNENGHIDFSDNKLNSYYKSASEDLKYLNELFKHIKISRERVKYNDNFGSIKELEEYIKCHDNFCKMFKSDKYDIIVDDNLIDGDGSSIKFVDKFLMILSNKNISIMLHELIHIYNKNSINKYYEMCSILAEIGIVREYNIKPDFDRISDILFLKMILNSDINTWSKYLAYCYGVGSIASIAFINKYGNNFKNIMELNEYVHNNPNISLKKLFDELNISDTEVINSTNNMKKILVNRQ